LCLPRLHQHELMPPHTPSPTHALTQTTTHAHLHMHTSYIDTNTLYIDTKTYTCTPTHAHLVHCQLHALPLSLCPIVSRPVGIFSVCGLLLQVVVDAYQRGRLIAVLPFITKLLECCKGSKIFTPSNPMIAGILSLLAELHGMKVRAHAHTHTHSHTHTHTQTHTHTRTAQTHAHTRTAHTHTHTHAYIHTQHTPRGHAQQQVLLTPSCTCEIEVMLEMALYLSSRMSKACRCKILCLYCCAHLALKCGTCRA